MSEIRRLVGEDIYQDIFLKKEMKIEIGDKRSSSPMNETRSVKVKRAQPIQSSEETRNKAKCICKACGKIFSGRSYVSRHKKRHCKARLTTLKLEWNGDRWVNSDNRFYYRLQLGQNLFNLIEKGAIKEDVLNCTQKEYVNMYKKLFSG